MSDGHEVYALDWLGHGASDKPTSAPLISFDLHIRTLVEFFERYDVRNCYIAAHDWGGFISPRERFSRLQAYMGSGVSRSARCLISPKIAVLACFC